MTLQQPPEPVHSSASTRMMSWVLRSALGGCLGTTLAILRLRGRTSGTLFELPVQYATVPKGLVVMPGKPETKQWWRNLREPHPVEVLRNATWLHARGIVLYDSDTEYAEARAAYSERWPRIRVSRGQPLVLLTWLDECDQAAAAS